MEYALVHLYLLEVILVLILLVLLIVSLLYSNKKNIKDLNPIQEKINRKYKSLQQKHDALHTLLNKMIVEKTTLKSEFVKLTEYTTKLEKEKDEIEKKYNLALSALDSNKYKIDKNC